MKASSESGLCATVISRALFAELWLIDVVTPDTVFVEEGPSQPALSAAEGSASKFYLQAATQTAPGYGGHRHFQKLRNQERIQTEKCSALPTVRHYRQPAEASGEQ